MQANGGHKGQSALSRLGWFVGIWVASVLALALIAGVLRWALLPS